MRRGLNHVLAKMNLRLEMLTAEKQEAIRLACLKERGGFDGPAFPAPWTLDEVFIRHLLDDIAGFRATFDGLTTPDSGFSYDNDYFSAPDVETLYAMLRRFRPRTIVEVGSGNSTFIMRRAIRDGDWNAKLIAIDPQPRQDVSRLADDLHGRSVEELPVDQLIDWLSPGGLLFIDSSHAIRPGNDVNMLFLKLLPRLPAGTLIHIHDIYLPYEYPLDSGALSFTEQYLLQALFATSSAWEILWPGYQLQQTWPNFRECFPHWRKGRNAVSFWIRKRGAKCH